MLALLEFWAARLEHDPSALGVSIRFVFTASFFAFRTEAGYPLWMRRIP